jgi:hypothetical protein
VFAAIGSDRTWSVRARRGGVPDAWNGLHTYYHPVMLEELRSGELVIEPGPVAADGSLVLVWKGRSTDRQPWRAILPYATVWLEKALHQGVPLVMRFDALEHMNSSTITAIVQILREAKTRRTRVSIHYDPTKRWQKLGFEALRVFETSERLLELVPTNAPPA